MVVFPEGTRFNPNRPDVIQKSKQFAKERGKDKCQYEELYLVAVLT